MGSTNHDVRTTNVDPILTPAPPALPFEGEGVSLQVMRRLFLPYSSPFTLHPSPFTQRCDRSLSSLDRLPHRAHVCKQCVALFGERQRRPRGIDSVLDPIEAL